jgi:hypothetical protein
VEVAVRKDGVDTEIVGHAVKKVLRLEYRRDPQVPQVIEVAPELAREL